MREWLAEQLDYISLWHGLALMFLASVCLSLSRQRGRLPWEWLGLFGLFQGVSEWLETLALSLPDPPAFHLVRSAVRAAACLPLIEFGRQGWQRQRGWAPGRWAYLALLGLAALGSVAGTSGFDAACHYALGLTGGLLAGWVLLSEARRAAPAKRQPLGWAGLALLAYGLSTGLSAPKASLFPASILNPETILATLGLPTQLIQALCAVASALAVLVAHQRSDTKAHLSRFRNGLVAAAMLVLLTGGWWAADWSGRTTDDHLRKRTLSRATEIAETIDPQQVKALSFTLEDRSNPHFQRLRQQMIAFGQVLRERSIYSMALHDGQIVFGPENIDEQDPLASPPGTVYEQPTPQDWEVFRTGRPFTEGPSTDEYGTFVSAFAPVRDRRTAQVLLVVGLDILVGDWRAQVAVHRLVPIALTLALALILLAAHNLPQWRLRRQPDRHASLSHADVLLIGAFGLVLTAGVALLAHYAEADARRATFAQLADTHAGSIVETMQGIRDGDLGGLARFHEARENVTREEFQIYTRFLAKKGDIWALAWAPRVRAAEKSMVEARARAGGMEAFTIFQRDPQAGAVRVQGRDEYYPVLYLEPLAGNEEMLGLDLGSTAIERVALEEAGRTGLPTATDLLTPSQEAGPQRSLWVYYPVFRGGSRPDRGSGREMQPDSLRGFAVAVVNLRSALDEALSYAAEDSLTAAVDLFALKPGAAPQWLTSWPADHIEPAARKEDLAASARGSGLSAVYPLFVFGRAYAIAVRPGPAFLAAHPARAGWVISLVGFVLACGATGLVGLMSYRRAVLQREVEMWAALLTVTKQANGAVQREEARAKALLDLSQMIHLTTEQITEYALDTGLTLTNSAIGYIAFTSADETILRIAHYSKTAMEQCAMADKPFTFVVQDTALLGEALRQRRPIITNDYAAPSVSKKGTPPGHVSLTRHASVPVFDGDRIVVVVGVGNKETDYTAEDVIQLTLLMDGMWKILCRKQAEEQVQSLSRFPAENPSPVLRITSDGTLLHANAASAPLLADWNSAVGQRLPEAFRAKIRAVLDSGSPHEIEVECAERTFSCTLAPVTSAGYVNLYGHDITERKRAEDGLARAKREWERTFDNVPDLIAILDPQHRIVRANRAMAERLGARPDQCVGLTCYRCVHGLDAPPDFCPHALTVADGREHAAEVHEDRLGGDFLISCTPLFDDQGQMTGAVHVARDITQRKQAEEALRTSEERFRSLVANIPGIVFRCEVNPPWRVQYCSEAILAISGYPASDFVSGARTYPSLVHPDDLPAVERAVAEAVAAHRPFAIELRIHHADAGTRWVHARGQATYDASGTPLWLDGVILDITEQKGAEEALRKNEHKYRTLITNLPQRIFLKDTNSVYVSCNDKYAGDLNIRAEEIAGKTDYDFYPGDLAEQYRADDKRVIESAQTEDIEEKYLIAGREAFVHTMKTPVKDENGETIGVLGIFWDITEQKRVERTLVETAKQQIELNRLQQDLLGPGALAEKLTKITAAAVRLFDVDFCRIWITKAGDRCKSGCIHAAVTEGPHVCRLRERCLHLTASSGRYTHTNGEVHRRVPFGCYKIGRVASGEDHKFLSNNATADPQIHNHEWARELGLVSFAGYQLRPPGGETVGVLALFSKHVITPEIDAMLESLAHTATQVIQRATVEEEQRILQSQLAQAQRLESVGQLAAGIAHEINTPTQFVSDNTRFLQSAFPKLKDFLARYRQLLDAGRAGPVPPVLLDDLQAAASTAKLDYLLEQMPEALSDSLEGLERIAKIVRAMKDFAHPGQQSLSAADLNAAIESTVTVARNEWKYVAEMVLDLDPALPRVPCMLGDFNQVILNIVVNAAHAIADIVGDGSRRKGTITLTTRQNDGHVEVRIDDTGTGIPEEYRDRIFDDFFTTKAVGKGTGQGLAIARRVIVEKHHGTLTFETEMGKGTTFVIRLPIEPDGSTALETPAHEEARSTGR